MTYESKVVTQRLIRVYVVEIYGTYLPDVLLHVAKWIQENRDDIVIHKITEDFDPEHKYYHYYIFYIPKGDD